MEGRAIQERAAACAEELLGSELTHPFGPDWDVFKVRGKVFMLHTVTTAPIVTVKAAPDDGMALREMHPNISRGHHMNKKHWITLSPGGSIDAELVDELVTDSYLLVVANLPRAQRPVDPEIWSPESRPR